jgi:hypothetical protein
MLLLKGCPRCHGDLLLIRYYDEHTLSCLQCGYARELVVRSPRSAREGDRRSPRPDRPSTKRSRARGSA